MNLVRLAFAAVIFFVVKSILRKLIQIGQQSDEKSGQQNRARRNGANQKNSNNNDVFEADYRVVDKDYTDKD